MDDGPDGAGAVRDADERLFRALAHADRRRILDQLRERPMTTTELCAASPHTRFAVMKHLDVLEQAGLVVAERVGRQRVNHLNAVPILAIARRWIAPFEAVPADRLLRLKRAAEAAGGPDDATRPHDDDREPDGV